MVNGNLTVSSWLSNLAGFRQKQKMRPEWAAFSQTNNKTSYEKYLYNQQRFNI